MYRLVYSTARIFVSYAFISRLLYTTAAWAFTHANHLYIDVIFWIHYDLFRKKNAYVLLET